MQKPIWLLFFWQNLYEIYHCMIKSFTYRIPKQVVRHGHRLLDGVQMGDDVILKTSALITMNGGQNPIDIKPFVN